MKTEPANSRGRRTCHSGFSLIELMVAITLGLLLTAGMIQLFSSSKLTFQTNDALARVQENGRFALEVLKRDLREAGTSGFCAGRLEINNHLREDCSGGGQDFFDPNRAVTGWEFAGTGSNENYTIPDDLDPGTTSGGNWESSATSGSSLPSTLQGLVAPGSDVLIVRRLEPVIGLTADGVNNPNQASINLNGSHGLPDDAIVLVTNCANATDLFQNRSNSSATTFSAGSGSCSNPGPGNDNSVDWATSYDGSMQAFRVRIVAYYIGVNPNTGQPGLYRLDMSNGTAAAAQEELVEGAESLQILYGFSEAAPAGDGQSINSWLTAEQIPADGWGQVLAMRVGLTFRSSEIADGDRTVQVFNLSGANISSPGDGRLRSSFSSTVALRNRVIVI